ncbi:hypothetical protein J6590_024333 [Homalodisca vitripennis]|nr:hypothetical protein J6590_024333 [Homalodisca vitripennis]
MSKMVSFRLVMAGIIGRQQKGSLIAVSPRIYSAKVFVTPLPIPIERKDVQPRPLKLVWRPPRDAAKLGEAVKRTSWNVRRPSIHHGGSEGSRLERQLRRNRKESDGDVGVPRHFPINERIE